MNFSPFTFQFSVKPGFGAAPFADDSVFRNAPDFSNFLVFQPAKMTQLDDSAFALINFGQTAQSVIQRNQIRRARWLSAFGLLQRSLLKTLAGFALPFARQINQNASHQLRRHAKEMRAVLPFNVLPFDQADTLR